MFLNPTVDPVRFSTSWLVKAHTLSLIRALIALYVFASIITKLSYYSVHEPANDGQDFSYFTSLTFWALGFYFAVSALHAATYWWTGKPALASWGIVLQALHSIFYTTIAVYPLIVTSKCRGSWGAVADGRSCLLESDLQRLRLDL
jgi:cytochrome bd-type quinol oxidase subunit 2